MHAVVALPKIAAILSVVETCKRLQINLRNYLKDVLLGLPPAPSTTSPPPLICA
jgi:hypothetical protein